MSAVDYLMNKLGLSSDPVDVQGLIPGVTQGYDDAELYLEEGYDEALSFLENGQADAADEILKGLGLAISEREKWFDVATKALQPVIEFGKEYQKDARQFMDYAKELVFDPDAIYGTQMWESLKGQMVEAVTNSASAKSGLLSGNYLDEVSKRVMSLGADFRNAEIGNALSGFGSAMMPVQMGFGAESQIAGNAMGVGAGNASDYMGAYGQLGGNAMNVGTNSANLAGQFGGNMAGLQVDRASEIANLNLVQMLANQNQSTQNRNSLFSLAGTVLPHFMPFITGQGPTTSSGGGSAIGSFGGGGQFVPNLSRQSSYVMNHPDYG